MTSPSKKFFVKATGDNRHAAGTSKWLRIRDIKFNTEEERSEIKVRFDGQDRYVDVYDYESNPANLKFAMGSPKGMPVSWLQVKEAFKQIIESKTTITKNQLKEMIRVEVLKQLNEQEEKVASEWIEVGKLIEDLGLEEEVSKPNGDMSRFWNLVPPGVSCVLKSKRGVEAWPDEVPEEPKLGFDFDESWNKPKKINIWGSKRSSKNTKGFLFKTNDLMNKSGFMTPVTQIMIVIPNEKIVSTINPLSTLHKIYINKNDLRRSPYR